MRLSIPECPTCRRPAMGTADLIPGTALFTARDADGAVGFRGETNVHWDAQTIQKGPSQLPLVTCGAHDWETQIFKR